MTETANHISDGEIVEEGEIVDSETPVHVSFPKPSSDDLPIRNSKRKSSVTGDSEDEKEKQPSKIRRVEERRRYDGSGERRGDRVEVTPTAGQVTSTQASEKEKRGHQDRHKEKKKRSSRH